MWFGRALYLWCVWLSKWSVVFNRLLIFVLLDFGLRLILNLGCSCFSLKFLACSPTLATTANYYYYDHNQNCNNNHNPDYQSDSNSWLRSYVRWSFSIAWIYEILSSSWFISWARMAHWWAHWHDYQIRCRMSIVGQKSSGNSVVTDLIWSRIRAVLTEATIRIHLKHKHIRPLRVMHLSSDYHSTPCKCPGNRI